MREGATQVAGITMVNNELMLRCYIIFSASLFNLPGTDIYTIIKKSLPITKATFTKADV
jgi:hypothetical protein